MRVVLYWMVHLEWRKPLTCSHSQDEKTAQQGTEDEDTKKTEHAQCQLGARNLN